MHFLFYSYFLSSMGICTVPDWECVGRIGSHLGGFSKLFIYLFIHFGFTARLVGILVP